MVPENNTHSKRPTKIKINDNYQFGQKFYYWEYHRKAGWKWYIKKRYKDLKTEMILNGLLNIEQWNLLFIESTNVLSTFVCKSYQAYNRYFECNWISQWSNQCEILFVGAVAPLKFKSVIQCKLSYNYINYISAINIIQNMLNGNPLDNDNEIISKSILYAMDNLIHHQLQKKENRGFDVNMKIEIIWMIA